METAPVGQWVAGYVRARAPPGAHEKKAITDLGHAKFACNINILEWF
jgi:hypothetical protein